MPTSRTERSSYAAQGTGATTISKMSLLIELASKNRKGGEITTM